MKEYVTQDMSFAAFLLMKNYKIEEVVRKGRRVMWRFNISEEDLRKIEAEWPSSESSKFFNFYQILKGQLK